MLALCYDLLKSGLISYPRAIALSKNKEGFALISEVGSTKNSVNQLICKTWKEQYVFITEFTLSVPRAVKPVSIDWIFTFKL